MPARARRAAARAPDRVQLYFFFPCCAREYNFIFHPARARGVRARIVQIYETTRHRLPTAGTDGNGRDLGALESYLGVPGTPARQVTRACIT